MDTVNIIRFGAFYNEGARGAAGHAPSNDKVWGIARVGGALVNFWGRRNGVLKFKLHDDETRVMSKWVEKTTRSRGDRYVPVSRQDTINMLCPNLVRDVGRYFGRAVQIGTINTNF
jgi:hypothetical protein